MLPGSVAGRSHAPMVRAGDCGSWPQLGDGSCVVSSRLPSPERAWRVAPRFPLDSLKPTPPPSSPARIGAARGRRHDLGRTRLQDPLLGRGSAPDTGFTVTFALPKFLPVTVPVQVIRIPGDFATPASTTIDPNPVVAELQAGRPAAQGAAQPCGRKSRSRPSPQRPRPPRPRPALPRPERHRPADAADAALQCTACVPHCDGLATCLDCG